MPFFLQNVVVVVILATGSLQDAVQALIHRQWSSVLDLQSDLISFGLLLHKHMSEAVSSIFLLFFS